MRFAIVLVVFGGIAHAKHLPFEHDDLGACQALVRDGKQLVRTHHYERDATKRLQRERITLAGSTAEPFVHSHVYDAKGRLVSTSSDGDHTEYEYDPTTGKLTRSVSYERPASKTVTWVWTYRYDAQGRQVRTIAWSKAANATTIDKRYTYDPRGRVATIEAGGTIETRRYDGQDRLIRSDEVTGGQTTTFTYRYDAQGRRIEQAVGSVRIEYRYDCRARELKTPRPLPPSNNVRDRPGYCGRPNCGRRPGFENKL